MYQVAPKDVGDHRTCPHSPILVTCVFLLSLGASELTSVPVLQRIASTYGNLLCFRHCSLHVSNPLLLSALYDKNPVITLISGMRKDQRLSAYQVQG